MTRSDIRWVRTSVTGPPDTGVRGSLRDPACGKHYLQGYGQNDRPPLSAGRQRFYQGVVSNNTKDVPRGTVLAQGLTTAEENTDD